MRMGSWKMAIFAFSLAIAYIPKLQTYCYNYYFVICSPLLALHWHRNRWPSMTLAYFFGPPCKFHAVIPHLFTVHYGQKEYLKSPLLLKLQHNLMSDVGKRWRTWIVNAATTKCIATALDWMFDIILLYAFPHKIITLLSLYKTLTFIPQPNGQRFAPDSECAS